MTMVRIVNISKLIHPRQMREFQSAGPSSTLNSARGSTHGSLGSNLHQVEKMVVVVLMMKITMITKIVVIMMIVIAGRHQLCGFLPGWLHSELFPLKFPLSSNFLSNSPFHPSPAGRLEQLMSPWVIAMQIY